MEKKNKIIIILSVIIAILLIALGVMFFIFKDNIFNGDNEETKENKNIDWKTEYYNKLKDLEKENKNIVYSFIYLENKEIPILLTSTTNDNEAYYYFYTIDSKIKKIGEESFDLDNQVDYITKKDNNYYLTVFKKTAQKDDIETITVNNLRLKKNKIVLEINNTINVNAFKDNYNSTFLDKYGDIVEFNEISDYEYINDIKKENEPKPNKKESVIEYDKKYIADGTGDYDTGIYFIFYEDGKLEYSENMCEGFYHLNGTYTIEDERIIVNIPESLNGDGKWALKIISKDKLKFDESYKTFDFVCGFAKGFILKEQSK